MTITTRFSIGDIVRTCTESGTGVIQRIRIQSYGAYSAVAEIDYLVRWPGGAYWIAQDLLEAVT